MPSQRKRRAQRRNGKQLKAMAVKNDAKRASSISKKVRMRQRMRTNHGMTSAVD